jgi:hypothetical protein
LEKYHAEPSHGCKDWKLAEPPESLEVHGATGERLVYNAALGGQQMVKEIVAFRREGRVYSFIGLFWKSDDKAHQQLRRAVGSIIWRE